MVGTGLISESCDSYFSKSAPTKTNLALEKDSSMAGGKVLVRERRERGWREDGFWRGRELI